jgi:hypothetical protein
MRFVRTAVIGLGGLAAGVALLMTAPDNSSPPVSASHGCETVFTANSGALAALNATHAIIEPQLSSISGSVLDLYFQEADIDELIMEMNELDDNTQDYTNKVKAFTGAWTAYKADVLSLSGSIANMMDDFYASLIPDYEYLEKTLKDYATCVDSL